MMSGLGHAVLTACSADACARQPLHNRLENHQAVGAAEQRLARALRVRHHADDVPRLVADAGDGVRPIRSGWPSSVTAPAAFV